MLKARSPCVVSRDFAAPSSVHLGRPTPFPLCSAPCNGRDETGRGGGHPTAQGGFLRPEPRASQAAAELPPYPLAPLQARPRDQCYRSGWPGRACFSSQRCPLPPASGPAARFPLGPGVQTEPRRSRSLWHTAHSQRLWAVVGLPALPLLPRPPP